MTIEGVDSPNGSPLTVGEGKRKEMMMKDLKKAYLSYDKDFGFYLDLASEPDAEKYNKAAWKYGVSVCESLPQHFIPGMIRLGEID